MYAAQFSSELKAKFKCRTCLWSASLSQALSELVSKWTFVCKSYQTALKNSEIVLLFLLNPISLKLPKWTSWEIKLSLLFWDKSLLYCENNSFPVQKDLLLKISCKKYLVPWTSDAKTLTFDHIYTPMTHILPDYIFVFFFSCWISGFTLKYLIFRPTTAFHEDWSGVLKDTIDNSVCYMNT